ncbi:fasciclin domain-containing protein [Nesterenkonia halobia]
MRSTTTLLGIGAVALLGLTACGDGGGSGDSGGDGGGETSQEESSTAGEESQGMEGSESPSEGMESSDESGEMDPAANLVGSQCSDYAEQVPEGDGSVAGMAQDPVATAASNNPMLTTLTDAVSGELNEEVDLVDTLNGDEFTVLAPVDDAFADIPEEDLNALAEDPQALTDVLTYHVIPGQMSPEEIAGEHETVNGATVTIEGEGEELMFDDAGLVCGGVQTANATVYMIDGVLMPEGDEQ